MKLKNILAYTNPITLIAGIPILCGIILAVITNNIAKNTAKVMRSIDEDVMD